jgi:pSer/pThr/pTyr-binding forkhead associated (FHA) protein
LTPKIQITVSKSGKTLEKIELKPKSYYLFGRSSLNDVNMQHPSISTHHAALIITEDKGPYYFHSILFKYLNFFNKFIFFQKMIVIIRLMVDLDSRGKTFVDLNELEPHMSSYIKPNTSVNFAFSQRKYTFQIDYSHVKKHI